MADDGYIFVRVEPFGYELFEGQVPTWLYAHIQVIAVVLGILAIVLIWQRVDRKLSKGSKNEAESP
jgi:hypothetical protein